MTNRIVQKEEKILRKIAKEVPAKEITSPKIKKIIKNMKEALEYYQRASNVEPDNPKVLLSIARTSHELENYGTVRETYEKLKLLDPELAERFSYLDLRGEEASRAAEINEVMEVVVWDEE